MSKRTLALVLSAIVVVVLAMLWLWLGVPSSSRVQQTPVVTQANTAPSTSPQPQRNTGPLSGLASDPALYGRQAHLGADGPEDAAGAMLNCRPSWSRRAA